MDYEFRWILPNTSTPGVPTFPVLQYRDVYESERFGTGWETVPMVRVANEYWEKSKEALK